MGEAPLSLHLDAEIRKELSQEARLLEIPESEVAKQAIQAFLDLRAHEREEIAKALAEADKGVFISSEAMLNWMDRLESNPEAAPPEPDVFLPPRA